MHCRPRTTHCALDPTRGKGPKRSKFQEHSWKDKEECNMKRRSRISAPFLGPFWVFGIM
jgi:hypothetical protein